MPFKDFINWTETNEADKIEYYNDNRKHGIIEVFCRIKLPYKFYEVASMLSIIYEAKSFDDYVSARIYEEIERYVKHGTEPIGDAVLSHITSEETEWHSAEVKEKVKDTTAITKDTTAEDTKTYPDLVALGYLASKEEYKKWCGGKIPDDLDIEDDNSKEDSNKIG